MATFRDAAIQLAATGFRVFPLAPGSKDPALEANWRNLATSDCEKVSALWSDPITGWDQPYNIGVALDADTLVIDVDVRDGKRGAQSLSLLEILYDRLPRTLTVKTASGGSHYYFRVDPREGPFGAQLAEHVDMKTLGGYVVGAGSVIGGIAYGADDAAIVDFPDSLLDVARRSARPSPPKGEGVDPESLDSPGAVARAVAYLENDAPDSGTYKVACRVKDFGVSEAMAVELMATRWSEPRSLGKSFEHIADRVDHAYRYGQSPVGVRAPEAEFEAVEVEDRRTVAPRPKLYFDKWEESALSRTETYLIEGWYDQGAMVVTYGESNVGKSNIALSQAVAIATGQEWGGARVRQGLVVYIAAEGSRGFRKRIAAYKKRFGVDKIPFALVPCPIDLLRPAGDTKALIALVAEAEAAFGQKCAMVVVDTLARALAGGNENAPDDMGALVMHCDRIRAATKATLHLIHHSGKNLAAGARGHSSLRAATDTEIEIAGEGKGRGTIAGTKQRDIERSLKLVFEYEVVDLGKTEGGSPLTSIVTHVRKETEFETRLEGWQEDMLTTLVDLARVRSGETDKTDITDKMLAQEIGTSDWKSAFQLRHGHAYPATTFRRGYEALVAAGCATQLGAVKGKESLWKLLPRQSAPNCAAVELAT